jgi:ribose/xylose/arabinose/galactoside ABC-type transport system permease subunit
MGYSIAYFRMIPFVVTLAMSVAMGAAILVTNQVSISGIPEAYMDAILAKVGGVASRSSF